VEYVISVCSHMGTSGPDFMLFNFPHSHDTVGAWWPQSL
jgi:hypothetical protein